MKYLLAVLSACLLPALVHGALRSEDVVYTVGDQEFTGYLVYDDSIEGSRPGVIVVHEWWGHNDYARKRADMLAELGYTAFALDMYGTGKLASHPDDAMAFMQVVTSNMSLAEQRFAKARSLVAGHASVDGERIAAIGYCFGGGVVLHMARAGVDLDAVVSFHGSLGTQRPAKAGEVSARVLVFNGAADPYAPPEQVEVFEQEMKKAGVDYELHNYPGVKHSFTNPAADAMGEKFDRPLKYDAQADKDSWARTAGFLQEVFAR